jgi:hypothetical protein
MTLPLQFRAGDTVQWRNYATTDAFGNPITPADGWSLSTYFRSQATGAGGITVSAAVNGQAWESTISAATSLGMTVGAWYWQTRAVKGSDAHTIGTGTSKVLAALSYSGTAASYDGRTQSQIDLEAVQAAIRAVISGGAVKRYMIGSRQLEKFSLAELVDLESRLKARVARELAAERVANGLGNPGSTFVRFI